MAVFRVEKNSGYTVMSNHHLRNQELSLKAKGLLSQMLSLPDNWDYTLKGLSLINREKIDAIREAIRELERAGYIVRSRERDEKGRLRGADYVIYELPQKPVSDLPTLENPILDNPTQENPTLENPTLENPTQLNKDILRTDLSKKERSITDISSTDSIPIKDPEDKKKWIVDEEAAAVVQKIFSLCVDGLGPTQIAKWLKQHQILNPTAYAHSKGLPASNKPTADPYKWTNETVSRILERVDYLGHTVNFKTTKQSYKSKKKLWNDPADWVIFENTQPAIIEESVFIIVQNIRKSRRRPTKMGDMGIFSGLLYCAECGGKMYQCRATNFTEEQKYFICSTYRKGKDLCTTHSIRNVVLHEIVLKNLREAIQYVSQHEAEFMQEAADISMRDRDAEFARKRDTLAKADKRIAELDRIISRLYEDNVMGKLSDDRFIKMSHDYELEQSNLKSMAEVLRKELKQQEQQKTNAKAFVTAVKKYTDMQELDAAVLREFIDRIEVSHADKKSKTREITIVYNFIGAFDFTRAIEEAHNTTQKQQKTA